MPSADRAAPAAASGAVAQRAKVEKADRTPEAWLKEIGELKREGKLKEALAELETFRKRFPDYVLPPELKELR
jgi:TolA-binding protein